VCRRRRLGDERTCHLAQELKTEDAWRIHGLVVDWIRHADSKAGVTLAACAALATVLFTLVEGLDQRTLWADLLVVLTTVSLAVTFLFCAWTLIPRVARPSDAAADGKRIFFGSIAAYYGADTRKYGEDLLQLAANPREMVEELAGQIQTNATIAAIKSQAARRAVISVLVSSLLIAATAAYIGIANL